jgi:hypothetical protein
MGTREVKPPFSSCLSLTRFLLFISPSRHRKFVRKSGANSYHSRRLKGVVFFKWRTMAKTANWEKKTKEKTPKEKTPKRNGSFILKPPASSPSHQFSTLLNTAQFSQPPHGTPPKVVSFEIFFP